MGAAMKKIGGCSEVEDLAKAVGLVVVFDHVHFPHLLSGEPQSRASTR